MVSMRSKMLYSSAFCFVLLEVHQRVQQIMDKNCTILIPVIYGEQIDVAENQHPLDREE